MKYNLKKESQPAKKTPIVLNTPKNSQKLPQVARVVNNDSQIFISLEKYSIKLKTDQFSPLLPKLGQKQNTKPQAIRQILAQKKVHIKLMPLAGLNKSKNLECLSKSENSSFNKKTRKLSNFSNSMFLNDMSLDRNQNESQKNQKDQKQPLQKVQINEQIVESLTIIQNLQQNQPQERLQNIEINQQQKVLEDQNQPQPQKLIQQNESDSLAGQNNNLAEQKKMQQISINQANSSEFVIVNEFDKIQEGPAFNQFEQCHLKLGIKFYQSQPQSSVKIQNVDELENEQQDFQVSVTKINSKQTQNLSKTQTGTNQPLALSTNSTDPPLFLTSAAAKMTIPFLRSDWVQTIQEMKQSISKIKQSEQILVQKQIFECFVDKFKNYHLTKDEKEHLFSLFFEMLNVNYGEQQLEDEMAFCGEMGHKVHKLETNLHFKHKECIENLRFVLDEDQSTKRYPVLFPKLQFSMDFKQVEQVAQVVALLCSNNMDAFAFMSLYLQICIGKKLHTKPFNQIEEQFCLVIKFLQTKYPANSSQNTSAIKFAGIEQIKFDHNFQSCKFQTKDESNYNQLKDFVIKKAEHAKKDHAIYTSIVKDACVEKGYGFKSDLKIKSTKHVSAIFRVIQKLLGSKKFQGKFKQMKQNRLAYADQKLKYFQNGLIDLVYWEKQQVQELIKQILQNETQIEFKLKDLVRGKCKFNSIEQIQETISLLKQKIKGYEKQGVQIIELENRLGLNTKDVVIFLKLPNSVAQLQLALKQDTVLNQFNHKIYEIKRSKLYAHISNLCLHNQAWCEAFFTQQLQTFSAILANSSQQYYQQNSIKFSYLQKCLQSFKSHYLKPNSIKYQPQGMQRIKHQEQIQLKLKQISTIIKKGYSQQLKNKDRAYTRDDNSIIFYFKNQNLDRALKLIEMIDQEDLQDDLTMLRLKCDILREKDHDKEAIDGYKKYAELERQQNGETLDLANVYLILGEIYFENKQFPTAIYYYNKCSRIKEQRTGKDNIQLSLVYSKMGNLHRNIGNYPMALQFHEKSLHIIEKTIGNDSLNAAQTLSGIGTVYHYKADYQKALEFYKKSLEIYERIKSKISHQVSVINNNIGTIYKDQGYKDKALHYYEKCLSINQKLRGKQSIDVAQVYNNLGLLYQNALQYDKALQYYKKCLEIRKKLKDEDNIVIAETYFNLGNLLSAKKQYVKASEFLKRSLVIKSTILGTQSIGVAQVMHSIGVNYRNQKDPKALEYFNRSLQIFQSIKGKQCIDSAKIYINIGIFYEDKDQYDKARKYYQIGLEIEQKIRGTENIDVAMTYYNISILYTKLQQFDSAYRYGEKAYKIWLKILKQKHEYTALALKQVQLVKRSIQMEKSNSQNR